MSKETGGAVKMDKHTALPFAIDGYNTTEVIAEMHDKPKNYRHICDCQGNFGIDDVEECKANAAFIVEACNNHYRLLAENKRLAEALDKVKSNIGSVAEVCPRCRNRNEEFKFLDASGMPTLICPDCNGSHVIARGDK